jgi:hypothetical protein
MSGMESDAQETLPHLDQRITGRHPDSRIVEKNRVTEETSILFYRAHLRFHQSSQAGTHVTPMKIWTKIIESFTPAGEEAGANESDRNTNPSSSFTQCIALLIGGARQV